MWVLLGQYHYFLVLVLGLRSQPLKSFQFLIFTAIPVDFLQKVSQLILEMGLFLNRYPK